VRTLRALPLTLVSLCLLVLSTATAQAASLSGGIGFGGLFTPSGGATLDTATGIDITFATVTATAGDFVPAAGAAATFSHLNFAPPNTPIEPLWTVAVGATTYSFDLSGLNVDLQTAAVLNLSGDGTLMATGFDNTAGEWTFSGQEGNVFFTFSAITSVPIPEPGTALLLGLGLVGLGVERRR
jgi:PEP-CTERM motif